MTALRAVALDVSVNVARVCAYEGCLVSLAGRKATTKYCTDAHRVAACRARKRVQEAENAAASSSPSGHLAVTLRGSLVTLGGSNGHGAGPSYPPCPDPSRCEYRHRHASGPWTCDFNHPSGASGAEAA
jgi:hypothetical protein